MSHSANVGRRCSAQVGSLVLWVFLLIGFGVLMTTSGCGRRVPKAPATPAAAPIAAWAPRNPSPAFLRAAKVLKPLPEEVQQSSELLPALFELFGTLTDDQIKTFLQRKQAKIPLKGASESTLSLFREKYGAKEAGEELVYDMHEVSVPYRSLTAAQREAFDKAEAALLTAMKSEGDNDDLLVHLYKIGAKEDLSNVDVGFSAIGHEVQYHITVRKGGSATASLAGAFAQL